MLLHSKLQQIPVGPYISKIIEPNSELTISDIGSFTAITSPVPPAHLSPPKRRKSPIAKKPDNDISKLLRLLNLNYTSVKNKKEHLLNTVDSVKPDIIFSAESCLTPDVKNNEIFPRNFEVYKKNRSNYMGGGVFLAIKKFISSSEHELDSDSEVI